MATTIAMHDCLALHPFFFLYVKNVPATIPELSTIGNSAPVDSPTPMHAYVLSSNLPFLLSFSLLLILNKNVPAIISNIIDVLHHSQPVNESKLPLPDCSELLGCLA